MPALELTKPTGDIFAILERVPVNAYIYTQWIGIQSLETMQKGGNKYLELMREQSCSKYLSCHKELIGPWDAAVEWIVENWAPAAISLGLKHLAHVIAPGIYGQNSFHMLHQHIQDKIEIQIFDNVPAAQNWLNSIKVEANIVA